MSFAGNQEIVAAIKDSLANEKSVELPPIPLVAAELLTLTSPEEPSFPDIADCIARDPVITAKIVGMANSAFFRGRREFQTIQDALPRLGTQVVRAFAMGVAASSLASAPGNCDALRSTLWNHCVATAVSTKMIAARTQNSQVDVLFLGGLFRDVGNLLTLHLAVKQQPDLSPDVVLSILEKFRVEAGVKMLTHWEVPEIYQKLLRFRLGLVGGQEDLSKGPLLIQYASDASRALDSDSPLTVPMDLMKHPLRDELELSEEVVKQMQEELPARVCELAPFMTH